MTGKPKTPDAQLHFSQSQVGLLAKCPQAFAFRYGQHLKKPPSGAMAFGTSFDRAIGASLEEKIESGENLPTKLIGDASRASSAAYCRYLVTGEEEDRRWATVLAFCSIALAGNNGGRDFRTKSDATKPNALPYWFRGDGRQRTWAASPGALEREHEAPGDERIIDIHATRAQMKT